MQVKYSWNGGVGEMCPTELSSKLVDYLLIERANSTDLGEWPYKVQACLGNRDLFQLFQIVMRNKWIGSECEGLEKLPVLDSGWRVLIKG